MATSPRPWTYRPAKPWSEGTDQGAFVDADGNEVCWFGDAEMYYPTEGSPPSDEDVALILYAINAIPNDK